MSCIGDQMCENKSACICSLSSLFYSVWEIWDRNNLPYFKKQRKKHVLKLYIYILSYLIKYIALYKVHYLSAAKAYLI